MLTGEVTLLRDIERSDLAQLLEWRNNPELRMYFREHRELSMEWQTQWFEEVVMKGDRVRMFSICNMEQELLGACGLCQIDWVNRSADFSIYIGYNDIYIDDVFAIDAAQLLIKYGFEELNLHRLWAEIYDFDERKTAMFERLEFEMEGRHRETHWTGGQWCDSLFFGLLNPE